MQAYRKRKNERRDFPGHFNTACWIMCCELNLFKTNTTKPLVLPLAKLEPPTELGMEAYWPSLFLKKECLSQPN